jgi:hypothetical protein
LRSESDRVRISGSESLAQSRSESLTYWHRAWHADCRRVTSHGRVTVRASPSHSVTGPSMGPGLGLRLGHHDAVAEIMNLRQRPPSRCKARDFLRRPRPGRAVTVRRVSTAARRRLARVGWRLPASVITGLACHEQFSEPEPEGRFSETPSLWFQISS